MVDNPETLVNIRLLDKLLAVTLYRLRIFRMPYDRTDPASIEAYARLLINQTLRNYIPANVAEELSQGKSKGKF